MKKLIMSAAITLAFAVTALAADVITLTAKNGDVNFPHKKHQQLLKSCKACHEKSPGKIAGFSKDMAHKLCIDCHASKGKGPMKADCKKCHTK